MSYDHIPRPLIEEHYHIRELIERQDKRSQDRSYHQQKIKDKEERTLLIKDSKRAVLTDFFCPLCKLDFKSVSFKQVEQDWSNMAQDIAFYRTKCFKGHWCIRHITDKLKDTFWMNSKAVAKDRGKHFKDIIQPFENNYNLLYGKR